MNPIQLFKAMSDLTRLRSLFLLVTENDLCVCELTHALGLPQPKVSHHLAILRKSELVNERKVGLWIYYRINPELPAWVKDMLHTTVNETQHEEPFASDALALADMPNRPAGSAMPDFTLKSK